MNGYLYLKEVEEVWDIKYCCYENDCKQIVYSAMIIYSEGEVDE